MREKGRKIQVHWQEESGPEAQERLLRAFEILIKVLPAEVIEETLKSAGVDKTGEPVIMSHDRGK